MKKKKKIICVFLLISSILYGQEKIPTKTSTVKFQNVVFIVNDTTSYDFTKFIRENGDFYFQEGLAKPSDNESNLIYSSEQEFLKETIYSNISDSTKLDSIHSYFPIKNVNYDNRIINIIDEVKFTHVLEKMGEKSMSNSPNSMIRLLFPCKDLNQCNSYLLFKLKYIEESVIAYTIHAESNDMSGVNVIGKDSCNLSYKDIEKIKKHLDKIENSYIECRRPGNPWLLETNLEGQYQNFIISYNCLKGHKELRQVSNFYVFLRSLNNKYFRTICN